MDVEQEIANLKERVKELEGAEAKFQKTMDGFVATDKEIAEQTDLLAVGLDKLISKVETLILTRVN